MCYVSGIYLWAFLLKRFVKKGVLYEIFERGGYRTATYMALGGIIAISILSFLPKEVKQSAWTWIAVLFLFISFITVVFGLRLWKIEKKLKMIQ